MPRTARILIEGMRALGFETLLPDRLQAPIIVTFHMPDDPNFVFQRFYDALKERGYVIYPGKLTVADSFRIGCIGRLYAEHMRGALDAVRDSPRRDGRRSSLQGQQGRMRSSTMNMQRLGADVTVNGRSYRFPKAPTSCICIDGSEPGYIERAIEPGWRRTSRG